jgi:hypothetical protein
MVSEFHLDALCKIYKFFKIQTLCMHWFGVMVGYLSFKRHISRGFPDQEVVDKRFPMVYALRRSAAQVFPLPTIQVCPSVNNRCLFLGS